LGTRCESLDWQEVSLDEDMSPIAVVRAPAAGIEV